MCLHAKRECWVMILQSQLNVDNCDYERTSERIAHTSVTPNEVCGGTQLTRGKLRICAADATETKQFYFWRLEKCEVLHVTSSIIMYDYLFLFTCLNDVSASRSI